MVHYFQKDIYHFITIITIYVALPSFLIFQIPFCLKNFPQQFSQTTFTGYEFSQLSFTRECFYFTLIPKGDLCQIQKSKLTVSSFSTLNTQYYFLLIFMASDVKSAAKNVEKKYYRGYHIVSKNSMLFFWILYFLSY